MIACTVVLERTSTSLYHFPTDDKLDQTRNRFITTSVPSPYHHHRLLEEYTWTACCKNNGAPYYCRRYAAL